jgi:hypothetical protein
MEGFMAENATEERLEVAVDNTPLWEQLSALLRSQTDKDFLSGIFFADEDNTPSQNERVTSFTRILRSKYDDFDDLKPSLQRKALEASLREFERFEALEARIKEEKAKLSPAARARLEAKKTISDLSLSAKKREAELKVFLRDEGQAYRKEKKGAKIGGLGNIFHATLGRHVFAPLHRYIGQPIMSISETQKKQRGPFWKMVGLGALAILGTAVFVGSGGFLIGAIAAGGGLGLAMPCIGLAASAFFTWKTGKNIPEAYENWQDVRESALSEQRTRDEEFAAKNATYRDGNSDYVRGLEASASVIKMKGFDESDFQGREGSLDVTNGRFLMSKRMFQQYNGIVDVGFNRKTGELVFALRNTDGLSSNEITNMIEDIVARSTGKSVTQATVLGQSCDSVDAMTTVLEKSAKTDLLNNRLTELEKGLTPEILSKIVAKALVTPNPSEVGERGHPQILGKAAEVMEVSSISQPEVYTGFIEKAKPILDTTISRLTGGKINDLTEGNIGQITNAIMASSIENYDGLKVTEKKLALVKVLATSSDPATVTAAAIEASRLGITKKKFASIEDTAVAWANDPQDEKSNINIFTANILRDLEITSTSLGKKNLQEHVKTLNASAEAILTSTFSGSDTIEVGAWTLIKETQTAAART